MSEETDAPQGGTEAEAIAETSTVESTSEATTEQPEAVAENAAPADDTGEEAEPPKRTPWFQKRIDEVTAKKYEAEREAAYWRGIAEGRAPAQPTPQQPVTPPDRWEDPEGYDRWLIEQAKQEFQGEFKQQQRLSTYGERVARFAESNPDYNDLVTTNRDLPITPNMANVIFESDLGPQVAYHLGKNPQEARRIAALPDYLQAAELGKLEVKLSQPAPKAQPKTPPPPPPQTVSGLSAGLNKSPTDMTMAEYVEHMKAEGRL